MKLVNWKNNNSVFDILDNFDGYFNHFIDANYDYPRRNISINQNDKAYLINIEIPGFDKSEIDITVEEDILSVVGKNSDVDNDMNYIRKSINRSFYLPEDSKADKINAKVKNGILEIEIPKLKKIKNNIKKIQVN
tara:strand:- start:5160 stop:5564 length:405 start_codon:yes stop_codon:yes gene_type:complete